MKAENVNIFSFNRELNYKNVMLFTTLLVLPNLLGFVNLPTSIGFKIHFFQLGIFIAAMLYGPLGGLFSGAVGSLYSAMIMHNPYIVLFNMLLGFFFGLFVRKKLNIIIAVWLAFLLEIPILVLLDHFVVGLPFKFLNMLLVSLFISDTIWALVAKYIAKGLEKGLKI